MAEPGAGAELVDELTERKIVLVSTQRIGASCEPGNRQEGDLREIFTLPLFATLSV